MSERGSFTTEYIYCRKCLENLKPILLHKDKYLSTNQIKGWSKDCKDLPIIAGKIGGMGSGDEYIELEINMRMDIENAICCPLRIALLADDKECNHILTYEPHKE